jgi:3'(2'), 5'-bisphosphate nucleotidase
VPDAESRRLRADLRSATAVAERVARSAGELLTRLRSDLGGSDLGGSDPSRLRSEGDRRSHELVVSEIAASFPGDPVLSEEGIDDQARTGSARVWIVDPLDGTREYGEGRSDFAVHVALCNAGRAEVGVVCLPARGLLLSSGAPPPLAPETGRVRMVVSRTRATGLVRELAGALSAELVPLGSAGAKAAAVMLGEAEVYAHSGGMYEWDAAAPVAVASAAGLHVSALDGAPLEFNRPDPWMPSLLVCRPDLAEEVLRRVPRL